MKAYLICLPLLLAAAPAAAQVVTGTVEGAYGVAVSNASVAVSNDEGVVVAHRFTDASGRFTVHLPVAGLYRVRVLADQYQPATRSVRVQDNASASTRVQLRERNASTSYLGGRDPMSVDRLPKQPAGGASGRGSGNAGGSAGGKPAGREN